MTYIGHKRGLHDSCLQSPEIDVFKERVGLDACRSVLQTPQPLLGVFGHQLGRVEAKTNNYMNRRPPVSPRKHFPLQSVPFYRWPLCPL